MLILADRNKLMTLCIAKWFGVGRAPRVGPQLQKFRHRWRRNFGKIDVLWAFLWHFWPKNTNFDKNWNNIITLDYFWAEFSDFLALSKKFQKTSKSNIFESDFLVQIMAPKGNKTQKYGVIRCFSAARKAPRRKFGPFWAVIELQNRKILGLMKLQNFSGPPNHSSA